MQQYDMSARIGSDVGVGVPDLYTHLRPVSEVTEPSSGGGPSPIDERNRGFHSPYATVDLVDDPGNRGEHARGASPVSDLISPMSSYRGPRTYRGGS